MVNLRSIGSPPPDALPPADLEHFVATLKGCHARGQLIDRVRPGLLDPALPVREIMGTIRSGRTGRGVHIRIDSAGNGISCPASRAERKAFELAQASFRVRAVLFKCHVYGLQYAGDAPASELLQETILEETILAEQYSGFMGILLSELGMSLEELHQLPIERLIPLVSRHVPDFGSVIKGFLGAPS